MYAVAFNLVVADTVNFLLIALVDAVKTFL